MDSRTGLNTEQNLVILKPTNEKRKKSTMDREQEDFWTEEITGNGIQFREWKCSLSDIPGETSKQGQPNYGIKFME